MDMREFFRGLSDIFNTGGAGSAGGYLRACLAEADARDDRPAAVTILNEMIGYFRSLGDYPEAIAASERAIRDMLQMGRADSPDFGTTLLNAATAFRAAGHKDRALELYEKAASIYDACLPEEDPRLAGLRNNLSQLYLEEGRAEEARGLLRLALKALARRGDMRLESAAVYTNLALALFSSGEADEARAMLRAALDIFEGEGEPSSRRAPHYAAALAALAEAHCRMGAFEEAAGVYALALDHLKGYFGESRDYAVTLRNRSIALEKAGKREDAVACARQAEEILSGLGVRA